jgi:membrane-bound serine protease (ClpP class)
MRLWLLIFMTALTWESAVSLQAADAGLIRINGAIGPATSSYISRAIDLASRKKDTCLIIQLDTPGGLLESTKEIVEKFYSSEIPTVVYVSPPGAMAGSAGCFITMAADVAAMAPSTSIGAAHPVSIGPNGSEKMDDVMKKKLENATSTFIQGIAERRGRNAEWARSSVLESASITAEQALDLKVIEIIARDVPDLLKQLNGRDVNGKVLSTADSRVVEIPMAPREKLFQLLWRPEVTLILMLIAIYGLIGELNNPGAILPGVAGTIALVLVLYMSSILPINFAGVALIGLSIVLFIIDVHAPTHGVLTFGGIVAFFLGALMLFDRGDPVFRLSLTYIIPATALTAAFFIFIVGSGLRAQALPVKAGWETMLGQTVPVVAWVDSTHGKVFVEGEYWNAVSNDPIEANQRVEIVGIEGLTLKVKPKSAP